MQITGVDRGAGKRHMQGYAKAASLHLLFAIGPKRGSFDKETLCIVIRWKYLHLAFCMK